MGGYIERVHRRKRESYPGNFLHKSGGMSVNTALRTWNEAATYQYVKEYKNAAFTGNHYSVFPALRE